MKKILAVLLYLLLYGENMIFCECAIKNKNRIILWDYIPQAGADAQTQRELAWYGRGV